MGWHSAGGMRTRTDHAPANQAGSDAASRERGEGCREETGNTAAVCKKCYIHPAVLAAYAHGAVIDSGRSTASLGGANALRAEEKAVVNLILGERDSIEGRTAFHTSYAR